MDRLSSCYFCGATLDTQLSEYPVVPRRLQSDGVEGKTVVLCDGCRHKLGNVLEEVVAAVEDESTEAPDYEETDFEPIGPSANGQQPAGESPVGGAAGDTDQRDGGIDTVSTTETASGADDGGSPRSSGHSDATDDIGPTADSSASETAEESDAPSLTKLEYNKVMRLLQNREFPVDRQEIREVATSAYQIDPEEFDAVIDAAIERGLVTEENGQFVGTEDR